MHTGFVGHNQSGTTRDRTINVFGEVRHGAEERLDLASDLEPLIEVGRLRRPDAHAAAR